MTLDDQQVYWNTRWASGEEAEAGEGPSRFAMAVLDRLPPAAEILELGCGRGRDAAYFARHGHRVTAVDFAEAVIAGNQARYRDAAGLTFRVLDTRHLGRLPDAAYDVVYAHLAIHYFSGAVTRGIFREIARVLRPGGRLGFACKSTDDRLYGQGERIEPDMFRRAGHVRHFFSEAYARSCLGDAFTVEWLWSGPEELDSGRSALVAVVARKRPPVGGVPKP